MASRQRTGATYRRYLRLVLLAMLATSLVLAMLWLGMLTFLNLTWSGEDGGG